MRKLLQPKLPFHIAGGAPRSGRPRVQRVIVICSDCGTHIERYPSAVKSRKPNARTLCVSCHRAAMKRGMRRRANSTPQEIDRTHNGQPVRISHHGYLMIYDPQRARTSRAALPQGWHFEHRMVAAKILGRPLRKNEVVHHVNGIKTDNRPENLTVLSQKKHRKIHNDEITAKLRRLEEYERLDPVIQRIARRTLGYAPAISTDLLINAERIRRAAVAVMAVT